VRRLAVVAVLAASFRLAAAEPFSGSVLDGATLTPIQGATIAAPDGTTTRSDKNGAFRFVDLPAGPLEIAVSADGYEATTELVELPEGGIVDHLFILFRPGAASEVIEIEDEAPVPPPPGRQNLGRQEIQRIPGTRGDALTAIRSLPGVGSQPAAGQGASQVVIRGAAPEDSRITIDGIEVPILYHFFGLQSVLPTELIENIEFLPGGFGAEEGRATGGVINVVTRSEAVAEPEGFAELSFINVAGFVQAPLSKRHGVQLTAGLRRSTIDLLLPVVVPDSANLAFTTAPQYYDGQLRIDWRRSDDERITMFAIGSYDLLSLLNENLNPNEPDFAGAFDNETQFSRVITSWLRGKDRRTNRLTVSVGQSRFRFEIGAERYLRFGQLIAELRDDVSWQIDDRWRLRAGLEGKWDRRDISVRFPAPPAEGMPPPGNFSNLPLVDYSAIRHGNLAGAYVATDFRPVPRLMITPGVRVDHYAYLDDTRVSPRLQISQDIGRRWTAKLAMGAYNRGLEGAESTDPELEPEEAFQYVAGARHQLRDGVSIEASVFYTDKRRLITVDPLKAQTTPLTANVNRSYGRAYGAEALIRARLERFFGWLAYSVGRSDRIDGPDNPRRLFDYDQTHNFIAVGSYRLGRWELGGRWQYATGTPLTPVVGSRYLTDVNAFVPVYGELNSDRLEATHALDLRVDRSWRFRTWSLSVYLDVANVYAHARVLGYQYNYDYSEREPITELPIVPAIGVRGSF
jgi:hypothetical protein